MAEANWCLGIEDIWLESNEIFKQYGSNLYSAGAVLFCMLSAVSVNSFAFAYDVRDIRVRTHDVRHYF